MATSRYARGTRPQLPNPDNGYDVINRGVRRAFSNQHMSATGGPIRGPPNPKFTRVPVIAPRAADHTVWSDHGQRRSGINAPSHHYAEAQQQLSTTPVRTRRVYEGSWPGPDQQYPPDRPSYQLLPINGPVAPSYRTPQPQKSLRAVPSSSGDLIEAYTPTPPRYVSMEHYSPPVSQGDRPWRREYHPTQPSDGMLSGPRPISRVTHETPHPSQNNRLEPINAIKGVSYNPMDEPNDNNLPQYTGRYGVQRVDPHLVRENQDPGRQAEMPARDRWSNLHSAWKAPYGTYKQEEIYDPRFTGSGDPYRSYFDVNTGNVRYNYKDVERAKYPLFIRRTNVNHYDFVTPMGQVWPMQSFDPQEDYREHANSQFHHDALAFRESMTKSFADKDARRRLQYAAAPMHRNFSS